MKIVFNKKIVNGPWGGGNQILRLLVKYFKKRGYDVSFSLDHDTDIVIIMSINEASCSFSFDELLKFKKRKNIIVIHRINDNGSHRPNDHAKDDLMIYRNNIADGTVFISQWVKEYFSKIGLKPEQSVVIDNGIDRNLFYSSHAVPNPTAPIKIVSHHWSDNLSKGYDYYNKIDSFCNENKDIASFRFFGQCPPNYLLTCEKIKPKPYLEVPLYLRDQDVYLTATTYESGGCHIVEGMACGLIPMVYEKSGGPINYSDGFSIVYKDQEDMLNKIVSLYNNRPIFKYLKENIVNNYTYDYNDMSKLYLDFMMGCRT